MDSRSNQVGQAVLVALACLAALRAEAQSADRRLELGVLFAAPRLSEFEATDYGVGGRASYRLAGALAVEGELTLYPGEFTGSTPFSASRLEGLFGATVRSRSDGFAVFGKVRPGFVRWSAAPEPLPCIAIYPPPLTCTLAAGRTVLALDLGGGFELRPTERIALRLDVGDNLLRFKGPVRDRDLKAIEGGFWSHNLRITVGVGMLLW